MSARARSWGGGGGGGGAGPQGPQGPVGPAGAVGAQGPAGPAGANGVSYVPADTVAVAVSRALTNADAGKTLEVTSAGVTLTVPNGLTLKPGVVVIRHSSGTSVAASGGATINGATGVLGITSAVAALLPRSTGDAYALAGA